MKTGLPSATDARLDEIQIGNQPVHQPASNAANPAHLESGDADSVVAAIDRFETFMRCILWREGVPEDDRDDLMQEVKLRVVKFLHQGEQLPSSEDDLRRFFRARTRYALGDFWRGRSGRGRNRRPRTEQMSVMEKEQGKKATRQGNRWFARSATAETERDEVLEVLRVEVDEKMADKVADAADLYWQRYNPREISEVLNLDVRTVKKYLEIAKSAVQ
jgi:DNA-directed RNA polymerase specialized sigma24 family protein